MAKGNLKSRTDITRNITETFGYDNLNRLTNAAGKGITYAANGNITSMGDVGTMEYGNTDKPYQVTMLTPTGDAVPEREQTVTYTSFQRPNTLTENNYKAAFTYTAAGDRAKMQVTQSNNALLTRYYIGGQYELDAETNTERLYLGGDAYSAPAVYVKEANVWKIYYICRDYLGSITHIANADGSLKQEL
ncbi:MAG TPA: type IV secretion protein Rhs, partial [Porphyromonadaceae bacterium]|nr:type IV secretion protein Rhs [Porphyromonadaceae bacterium]